MLPHVANLFGFHARDSRTAERVRSRAAAVFRRVWEVEGWIAAETALPDSMNRTDIPPELMFAEGRDSVFPEGRDAHLIAEDVRQKLQNPQRLGELPGDFTFVRLERDGNLTAARACAGVAPLFLFQDDEYIAIATRLGDLVALLPEEPALDPTALAFWTHFTGLVPDRRALLRQTISVPIGHAITLRGGKARVVEYWDPQPLDLRPPTRARQLEHAMRMRELLVTRLERNLDPGGRNLLLLSGGVDSSSIAALTRRLVDRPFSTATFLPVDPEARTRELGWVDGIHAALELKGRDYRYDFDLDEALRLRMRVPPCVSFVFHPSAGALAEVTEHDDVRVLFCGTFADHLCGSVESLASWADVTPASKLSLGIPFGRVGLRAWASFRSQRPFGIELHGRGWLPEFIREDHRAEASAVARDARRRLRHDPRPLRVQWERLRSTAEATVVAWEAATSLNVRRVYPFLSREIVEFALECHPLELIWDGPKELLRRSLGDVVPARFLNRPDKGRWNLEGGPPQPWREPLRPEIAPVLAPNWWPLPPKAPGELDVLRLTELVNIVSASRIRRGSGSGVPTSGFEIRHGS